VGGEGKGWRGTAGAGGVAAALVMGFGLLVEGFLEAMDALPVVTGGGFPAAGGAEGAAEAGVVAQTGEEGGEVVAIFKPPTRLVMTGLPALQASRTTMPKGSCMEGRTKTSQAW
jgi:hypothetical protein